MRLWWSVIKFGFRLLYNELAFTYDLVSQVVSLGTWRCWQRTALKHLPADPNIQILELAHGTGNLQLDLYGAGCKVIGLDLSPYMGQIARAKLDRHQLTPRLVQGQAQRLPFMTEAFTAVVSTFPTHFIIDPATLREVHRILQPGGHFIIVPSGVLTGGSAVTKGLEWLYRITGQREHSDFDAVALFARHGFEAQLIWENCPHSLALVLIAQKRPGFSPSQVIYCS